MKIAQVSHHYLPHIGGIEYYVQRLADSLRARGENVAVLTTDSHTPTVARRKEARYFPATVTFLRNPFSLPLIRHLRRNAYDILHLHSVWFLPCLTAVVFRKKARVISTIHGVYPDQSSRLLRIFLSLYKPFVQYILNRSEKVLVYSSIEETKLKQRFRVAQEKIVVLPMAIPIEPYAPSPRQRFILFTGRIIPDKNPDLLLRAAALLGERFRDVGIVFVGPADADYRASLLRLATTIGLANPVEFTGQLNPAVAEEKARLMQYYRSASALVSLGSWEGQPTRILEAMQFETPVIAFSAGGTADMIADEQDGFLLTSLSEKMLAASLERILSDDTLARRIGAAARKTVTEKHDWEKAADRILALYRASDTGR